MASINPEPTPNLPNADMRTWNLEAGDVGEGVSLAIFGDRCLEVVNVGGGTWTLEGSIGGDVWQTLHDPFGNLLSGTANVLTQILETPRHVRAKLVGGTSATVSIYSRRTLR